MDKCPFRRFLASIECDKFFFFLTNPSQRIQRRPQRYSAACMQRFQSICITQNGCTVLSFIDLKVDTKRLQATLIDLGPLGGPLGLSHSSPVSGRSPGANPIRWQREPRELRGWAKDQVRPWTRSCKPVRLKRFLFNVLSYLLRRWDWGGCQRRYLEP